MTNVIPLEERNDILQRRGDDDAARWFDGLKLHILCGRLVGCDDGTGRRISQWRVCADYAAIAGIPRHSAEARLRQARFYRLGSKIVWQKFPTVTWEGFTVAMKLGDFESAMQLIDEVVTSEDDHAGTPMPVDKIEALVIARTRKTPAQSDAEALRRAARGAEAVRRLMVKYGGKDYGGWGVDQFIQRAEEIALRVERAEAAGIGAEASGIGAETETETTTQEMTA